MKFNPVEAISVYDNLDDFIRDMQYCIHEVLIGADTNFYNKDVLVYDVTAHALLVDLIQDVDIIIREEVGLE